jgi:hypothetical protein
MTDVCVEAVKTKDNETHEVYCAGSCDFVHMEWCPGLTTLQIVLITVGVLTGGIILTIVILYCIFKRRRDRMGPAPPEKLDESRLKIAEEY